MRQVQAARRLLVGTALGGAWLAFYAAWLAIEPGGDRGLSIFTNTAYPLPIVAATALAVWAWRAGPKGLRTFWAIVALANSLWLLAEILWAVRELATGSVPFPWWTDAGYLASYLLMPFALRAAFRPTFRTMRPTALLESVLVVGSLALLWWLVVLEPLPLGRDLASLVGLAYPLFGLVMIGMLVATRLLPARRGNLGLRLVGAGIAVAALADALYTHAAVTHSYLPGNWIALGWQAEAVLFAFGAYVSVRRLDARGQWTRFREPLSMTGGIAVGTFAALAGAFGYAAATGTAPLALFIAGGVLAALLVVRVGLLFYAEPPAPVVDPETGAYDRSALDDHVRSLAARARHFGEPFSVGLVAPDGAADRRDADAAELTRALVDANDEVDVVARLGANVVAVLLANTDEPAALERAETWRSAIAGALRADGPITPSIGVAAWDAGDRTHVDVVTRAEAALAAAQQMGGNQVRRAGDLVALTDPARKTQRFDLLMTLAESVAVREGDDTTHPHTVAALARRLAVELGLDDAATKRVYVAGLFHDLGKVAVPDCVLAKLTSPDAEEWTALEAHAGRGAELLAAGPELADAAPVVRAHHERWDGCGYPRRLAGEAIPREARILAVADAFVAMTSPRRHRAALSVTHALTEIWRYAGERFDKGVVSALLALGREGRLGAEDGALRQPATLSF